MLGDIISIVAQSFVPTFGNGVDSGDLDTTDRALDLAIPNLEKQFGLIRVVKSDQLWKIVHSLDHGYLIVKFIFPKDSPAQMNVEKISQEKAISLMVS